MSRPVVFVTGKWVFQETTNKECVLGHRVCWTPPRPRPDEAETGPQWAPAHLWGGPELRRQKSDSRAQEGMRPPRPGCSSPNASCAGWEPGANGVGSLTPNSDHLPPRALPRDGGQPSAPGYLGTCGFRRQGWTGATTDAPCKLTAPPAPLAWA